MSRVLLRNRGGGPVFTGAANQHGSTWKTELEPIGDAFLCAGVAVLGFALVFGLLLFAVLVAS